MQETSQRSSNFQIDEPMLANLRASMRGDLLTASDLLYDEARRVWNGMIDKRPAVVVRPSGTADVMTAVRLARERETSISVRGGGHNIAGAAVCDGGLMIDMSSRCSVRVDPVNRSVRVEGGATWADVDHETQAFGLVVPSGIVSTTGVAGFTLGSGFGWTSRKFGFAADNLISADVVTANGDLLHASEHENKDLFWALRGGGGNFGVVTSFEFEAHRHGPEALCGMVVYPLEQAREVVNLFREVTSNAPDELSCLLILRIAPPLPFLPAPVHGTPIAAIAVHWTGDPEGGEAAIRPIIAGLVPIADTIATKPFIAHQTMLDAGVPFGRRYYWKSDSFDGLEDGLGQVMLASAGKMTSPFSAIMAMHLDGVPARLDPGKTAVGMRQARYVLVLQSAWDNAEEDREHIEWARTSLSAARPFLASNPYVNFLTADEAVSRGVAAYHRASYERLRDVKTKYDPTNLFHGAHNIEPR